MSKEMALYGDERDLDAILQTCSGMTLASEIAMGWYALSTRWYGISSDGFQGVWVAGHMISASLLASNLLVCRYSSGIRLFKRCNDFLISF